MNIITKVRRAALATTMGTPGVVALPQALPAVGVSDTDSSIGSDGTANLTPAARTPVAAANLGADSHEAEAAANSAIEGADAENLDEPAAPPLVPLATPIPEIGAEEDNGGAGAADRVGGDNANNRETILNVEVI